ncbi:transposase [Pseudoalteromonas sp. CO325X]|uniref:Mu transposase C-terminal domain-containing protein n=1 Tax=Pseudoalteromonas sp. CO325X TaxID=1777262 RepID=UPI001022B257|nr:Mu transposase C-terminal domain-containing protein [Pseudoalteromonas sp. CO325X]RZF83739.1 transposase [Pseudoalteromonas sp. CO325X]
MKYYTAHQLADLLGVSKRTMQIKAKEEEWPYVEERVRGGVARKYAGTNLPEYVRIQVQEKEIEMDTSSESVSGRQYLAVTELQNQKNVQEQRQRNAEKLIALGGLESLPKKAEAKFRLTKLAAAFIQERRLPKKRGYDLFCEGYNNGWLPVEPELRIYVPSLSRITLLRWEKIVRENGPIGLVSRQGKKVKSIIKNDECLQKFCIGMIYEYPHVKASQLRDGLISRFAGAGKAIPSESATRRWLDDWKAENKSLYTKISNPDAWKNKFMSAMGKMDENITRINQLWEFDSTPADVMLTDGRFSLIGIIDVYTRRPAVVVHPTSNSEGICLVIRKSILEWGIPEVARTDNGKDYTSIQIKSVFDALEIEHQTTRPFSGEEKPYIERFFKTFSHDIAELLTGYIGHNVSERQAIEARKTFAERLAKRQKSGSAQEPIEVNLSAEQLQSFIDSWIENRYMHRPHSNLNGKTPHDVYAASRDQIRVINDERLLDVMLQPVPSNRGLRSVGKEGIKVSGGVYIAPELGAIIGEEVFCKWDPQNVGRIYVFNRINKEFVCIAVDPEIESAGLTRQEIAELAKKNQKAVTAKKLKEAKKTAKSVNVSDIANEVLDHYQKQNQSLTSLPKQQVEHTNTMMQSALAALDSERPVLDSERLSEIEKRRQQMQQEAEVAAVNPTPIFRNTNDKAMYLKQQRLERELTEKEATWLNTWEQQNRAMSSRFDSLIEDRDMASQSQHRQIPQ